VAMFRTALMPPKTPDEPVALMRAAFVELWQDQEFIGDYTRIVKSKPILVAGQEAQGVIAALGRVTPETRAFLLDYSNQLVK
jgi:hypothetical protein